MSFDDTTGMQNPIFKIMGSQSNTSNNPNQMTQNNNQLYAAMEYEPNGTT